MTNQSGVNSFNFSLFSCSVQVLRVIIASGRKRNPSVIPFPCGHFNQSCLIILVNNAGTNPFFGDVLSANEQAWDKTCDVDLKGYFFMSQYAATFMQKTGGGAIVNVASTGPDGHEVRCRPDAKPGYIEGGSSHHTHGTDCQTRRDGRGCSLSRLRRRVLHDGDLLAADGGMLA